MGAMGGWSGWRGGELRLGSVLQLDGGAARVVLGTGRDAACDSGVGVIMMNAFS